MDILHLHNKWRQPIKRHYAVGHSYNKGSLLAAILLELSKVLPKIK